MAKPNNALPAAYIREVLDYRPETGELVWRVSRGKMRAGEVAGTANTSGYLQVQVDGRRYRAHRLAWLIHHGRWPVDQLDHINGRRSDNRIENLREASHAENQQNKASHKNASSKFVGVSWDTRAGKWQAQIRVAGKQKYLGHFCDEGLAAAAYAKSKAALHAFNPVDRSRERGETNVHPK